MVNEIKLCKDCKHYQDSQIASWCASPDNGVRLTDGLIHKQWADDDNLEVQVKTELMEDWFDTAHPSWCKGCEYRFKPKTVPAWQVLYEDDGEFLLTLFHYKTEDEFNSQKGGDEKFIRFILETEKQVQT